MSSSSLTNADPVVVALSSNNGCKMVVVVGAVIVVELVNAAEWGPEPVIIMMHILRHYKPGTFPV